MSYVITGANGYIGSRTARALLERGENVTFIVRANSAYPRLAAVLEDFDASQYEVHGYDGTADSLMAPLLEVERVIHLASLYKTGSDPATVSELVTSNLKFSSEIFAVLQEVSPKAKVITTSTFSSFNLHGDYAPATVYAATKSAVETLAHAFRLDITFLRLSDTYGPADWRVKVHNLIRDAVLRGESFELRSPRYQTINLTHVDDIIRGFDFLFSKPWSRTNAPFFYDLYYPENETTLGELVELIKAKLPEAQVTFPLAGDISVTPKQKLPLPGFTPQYLLKDNFAATIFGETK